MFANKLAWIVPACATAIAASLADGAALYQPMKPPFVTWIDRGQARARIVAAKGADSAAAKELNTWLERITGVTLPVVTAAKASEPHVLLGSPQAWAKLGAKPGALDLGPDGYVIRTVGKDLVIAGETDLGTLFGVTAFLEHYLDCRWFWPGESGMYHPSQLAVSVGQVDEVSRPDFRVRWVIRDAACGRLNRLNVGIAHPDEFKIKWFVHTWLSLVPPKEHWRANPEYYAEIGGKRKDPTADRAQVNLCTANPAVAEAAADTIAGVMRSTPSVAMVSVDPMDTQQFCQCDRCRQLYDKDAPYERRASRLVFDFSNRVAERVALKHPGLLVKTIAYHTYLAPPDDPNFRLHDNVAIQFCRFMCHNHALNDPACAESSHFHSPLLAWCKLSSNVTLYEYYYKCSWCGLPWPIVHTLRRDLPYLHRLGVMGVATQWTRNSAANGLAFYVASKLLWDTKIDVDALLTDFYQKAYGQAAAPMRQYHERLEQAAVESGVHIAMQSAFREMLELFSAKLLNELDGYLCAAERLAREPRAAARVALSRRNWQYTRLVHEYLAVFGRAFAGQAQARWMGMTPPEKAEAALSEAGPMAKKIEAFLKDKDNREAVCGPGGYEQRLVAPRVVARAWHSRGDRPSAEPVLDKAKWLESNSQPRATRPSTVALWIYGNDLDWLPETGAEHHVYLQDREGKRAKVGEVGRNGRSGDRVNKAFILRGIALAQLPADKLDLAINNPPGGPYASHIFAVYVMPDDGTLDDQAQKLIEHEADTVRGRALGFVEFDYRGRPSNEGKPCEVTIVLPKARGR